MVTLRYLEILKKNHTLDWKLVIDAIGENIAICANGSVDILNELAGQSDQNIRLIAKSGVVKFIFFTYIFK